MALIFIIRILCALIIIKETTSVLGLVDGKNSGPFSVLLLRHNSHKSEQQTEIFRGSARDVGSSLILILCPSEA